MTRCSATTSEARPDRPAARRPRRDRDDFVTREDPGAIPLGDPREGPRGPLGIGLGAKRRVDDAEQRGAKGGLEAPGVADGEELDDMPLRAERRHAVPRKVVLRRGVDGLDRARLPELDVLAMVERHLLEQVEAARGEVRLQIRRMAPAGRVDHARIDARRAGGDLAPLEHGDSAAVQREVERRGCARDACAHDRDIRVPRALPRHDPGSVAHLRVPTAGTLAVCRRAWNTVTAGSTLARRDRHHLRQATDSPMIRAS